MQSKKYGIFIYNSTTNSFVKINEELYSKIKGINEWSTEIKLFDQDFAEILEKHNIVVTDDFDEEVFYKKKYTKYMASFNPSVLSLTIATTSNCNFKCPYCYEEGIVPHTMNKCVEDAIIKYLSRINKKINITWYGGEPLLNFGTIQRLTQQISNLPNLKNVEYDLVTNGYFLDKEKCLFFADKNLNSVQITLDGPEATHNNSRLSKNGKPNYHIIIKNIDSALRLLPNTTILIRVNIGIHNKEEYPILYKELRNKWKENKNLHIYFSFIDEYKKCPTGCLNSIERLSYIRDLFHKYKISTPIFPQNNIGICHANVVGNYVIAPNGDLYKCWVDLGDNNKKVGSIFDIEKKVNHNKLMKYFVIDKFNDSQCIKCFMFPLCAGGCAAYRDIKLADDICPYNYKNIDATLEIWYEIYSQNRNKKPTSTKQ